MKTFSIRRYLSRRGQALTKAPLLLLAGFAVTMSACMNEPENGGSNPQTSSAKKVRLALHTSAGAYYAPVATRAGTALDDAGTSPYDDGRMPMVLVFELPADRKTAYEAANEAAKANLLRTEAVFTEAVLATDGGSVPQVILSITENPVRLLIVANPPTTYMYNAAANSTASFTEEALNADNSPVKGVTFAAAVDGLLNTVKLTEASAGVVASVPYAGEYIPMSGYHDMDKVSADMTSIGTNGSKIALKRVVGKITVTNSASGFKFESTTVVNTKRYGQLYRHAGVNPPADNKVSYLVGTGQTCISEIAYSSNDETAGAGNTNASPLYVYESDAGEATVIVQGKYENTRYWYRLALKSKVDGSTLAIERNKHYEVQVIGVSGPGYSSITDALTGSVSNNIKADVKVTDLSGHETIDNGKYYLSLSNSKVVYYSDDDNKSILLTTISTNAPSGTPITITDTGGSTGLSLSWTAPTLTGDDVVIPLMGTVSKTTSNTTLDIKVGTLVMQLTVTNGYKNSEYSSNGMFKKSGGEFTVSYISNAVAAEVTEGKEWFSFAFSDGIFTDKAVWKNNVDGSSLKLKTTANNSAARYAEIIASNSGAFSGGRTKLYIKQEGIIPVLNVVKGTSDYDYMGGTQAFSVESYYGDDAAAWTAEFSTDDGASWSQTAPDWLASAPTSGPGGATTDYSIELNGFVGVSTSPYDIDLKAATPVGSLAAPYNLSTRGGTASMNTANCYIVNAAGHYKLPLVYGNAIKNGVTNTSAYQSSATAASKYFLANFVRHDDQPITGPYLYSQSDAGVVPHDAILLWMDAPGLITNIRLVDSNQSLAFEIPQAMIGQGNATLAVRDASGTILWSWHIWVASALMMDVNAPAVDETVNFENVSFNVMRYNLGWCSGRTTYYGTEPRTVIVRIKQTVSDASETITITQNDGSTKLGGNSPYWQWGRKDPMPGILGGSGAATRDTKPTYGNHIVKRKIGLAESIGKAICNPADRYCNSVNPWLNTAYVYRNLWSADCYTDYDYFSNISVKTVYDPCPAGFKVPTPNVFSGFSTIGSSAAGSEAEFNGARYDNSADGDFGWHFYLHSINHPERDESKTAFYPGLGFYNTSSSDVVKDQPTNVRTDGTYWTSKHSINDFAYRLFYTQKAIINVGKWTGKAAAYNVRPCAE